jgi:hypothetical protein
MTLKEIISRLQILSDKGFIASKRKGPTGIGHLLESELELFETNVAIPDVGGRVELKATRKNIRSLITLFTFNRGVWKIKQIDLITKYGYIDEDNRRALYCDVSIKPNAQGLFITIDSVRNLICLKHVDADESLAEWSTYVIAGKFMTKMDRLILVLAENLKDKEAEQFYFKEAYLLEQPTPEKFLEAFKKGEVILNIRMHLKESGGVRNHGTAIRTYEQHLDLLYNKKRKIL